MKLLLIILATLIASSNSISFFDIAVEEWELFKYQHKKQYSTNAEEEFRMRAFMDNKYKVAKHNYRLQKGEVSYELGLNEYADMPHHEFVSTLNGFNRIKDAFKSDDGETVPKVLGATYIPPPAHITLPNYVNWIEKGAVTEVKNQAKCGSCWSFSSTGALEGQHFRKTGVLVSLSEQNLIDCSTGYGNQGCNGGMMSNAFQYVKDNRGIDTELYYPYEAQDNYCRYNARNSSATDVGIVYIPRGDEDKLRAAVATIGPISVAIDASQESFQLYKSGIYIEPECSSDNLDHAVLVVGYGTDEETGQDYWIVKNSWGTTWGESGYIRMARNMGNQCGIATLACYPLV